MKICQSQPQFRDNLFLTKLMLAQHLSQSPTHRPQSFAFRSTWTNKIRRRKINEQKLNNFQKIFYNDRTPPSSTGKMAFPQFQEGKLQINQSCYRSNQSSGRRSDSQFPLKRQISASASHFNISRNIAQRDLHEDVSKSGILMEKLQKVGRKKGTYRCGDPRFFLKNLKIKGNINLYKGNFSKFLKKNVGRRTCPKKHNLTMDLQLSPWDISEKGRACY